MPIVKRPNRDALRRGIDIYIDTMREFITNTLQLSNPNMPIENLIYHNLDGMYRDRYWRQINKNDRCVESAIDIGDFKPIIIKNWLLVFDAAIDGDRQLVTNSLERIAEARNQAFHFSKSDLDIDKVGSWLSDIAGMMRRIDAREEMRHVLTFHRQLHSGPTQITCGCEMSLYSYIAKIASQNRTRHSFIRTTSEPSSATYNGHTCSRPYDALIFTRVQYRDDRPRPCAN